MIWYVHFMNTSERKKCDAYTKQFPEAMLLKMIAMGTSIEYNGLVSIVRRMPNEHSRQELSSLFASDLFFHNVWRALLEPSEWKPQELMKQSSGKLVRDSYVFFKENFCQSYGITPTKFADHPMMKLDRLRVVIDFASKNFQTDAQTVTYFLVDPTRRPRI